MNHIYRLVWNRALHNVQVASEIALPRGGGANGAGSGSPLRRRPLALMCLAALGVAGYAGVPVFAATPTPITCTWVPGTNGNWSAAGSWSQPGCNSTFPGSGTAIGDNAVVANGTATLDVSNINAGALTIGDSAGQGSSVSATGTVATDENFTTITIDNNAGLYLRSGAGMATSGDVTNNNGGTLHVGNDNGAGNTTLAVGGSLSNQGSIVVGEGGTTSPSLITVNGTFNNTGGYTEIDSGSTSGASSSIVVTGAASSTLEGTYNINQNVGTAALQFGSGGITQIGDGGTNGGSLALFGSGAYVEVGATNSNSALTKLNTIASNGFLGLNDGATASTDVALTVDGTLHVGNDNGGATPTTMSIGGNLTNTGNVVVGEGGTTSPSLLTVNGTFDNTGGNTWIYGGSTAGAPGTLSVTGAAPSTLEGSFFIDQNVGTAALQYGSGGITQIGDGGSNGGSLTLVGADAYVEVGNTGSDSALTKLNTIANNGFLGLNNGSTATTDVALTVDGTLHVGNDNGPGNTSLSIGGNLTNTGNVVVGEGGTTSPSLLTVNGTFTNTGANTWIYGGAEAGATSTISVTGAAPSTLEGSYVINQNVGTAALQYGSGGITQIGDGGTNGASLTLVGADAYVEIGDTNSDSALTGLTTIANNGFLGLNNGSTATTDAALTVDGTLHVGNDNGPGNTSLAIGGNLTNTGNVVVGEGGTTSPSLLAVNGSFDNTGTIFISGGNVTGATSTITATGPFTNNGTVEIAGFGGPEPAVLTAGTSGTDSGADYVQTASGANTTIYNSTGVLNAPNVAINGGALQGLGTVNGNVYNGAVITGGTGNQPGTLTINGNFENAGTGELAGPYGNTTAGTVVSNLNPGGSQQIAVSGAVTLLGGAIQGDAVNGFNYAAGEAPETVMTFAPGKLSGVFAGVQNGGSAVSPGTSTDLGNGLTLGVEYNNQAGNIQLVVVNTPATTADTWSGGTGNWNTASGWSQGAPAFYSDVKIGSTGSGDVTLGDGTTMQDATVESVTINSGNTLAYQATTPTSLSVGNTVTVNAGGALSLPTSGDTLALGGNFANSGTTTLGNGASLNTLGTFTNSGTGAMTSVGNGASVTTYGGPTSIAATNGAGATISIAGGSFTAPGLKNAGTVSGNGSIDLTDTDVANTGLVEASGGTLSVNGGGIQGTGNVTVDSGATLDLSHATAGNTVGTLAQNGSLDLGSNNVTVATDYNNANFGVGNNFNARQGVTGTGLINASGNVGQAITGTDVTGGNSTSPVLAFGNVHVGANTTTYEVENTGTSGPSLRGAIQTGVNGGGITDASLSGSGVDAGNWGPVSTGGNASFSVTWTPTQAGEQLSGQTVHIANNFANVNAQTLTITGAAYALADPTVTSQHNLNFGVVQVGQTFTDDLTVTNALTAGATAADQEGLNASFGTSTTSQLTGRGSISDLMAGQSNSSNMVVTLAPVTAGAIGGTIAVDLVSNGETSTGSDGLGDTTLTPDNLAYTWSISGAVINQANPSITPNPVSLAARVGGTARQALSVENVAGTPPQASLDAQITGTTGAATSTNLSSINQLAAGDTDSTSFVVGLNTATAGAKTGTVAIALQSDSTPNGCKSDCTVDLSPETINVTGNVYTPAQATVNTASPVNFGIVHVGDGGGTLSQSISVTNSAAVTALNDTLTGSVSASGAPFSGSGSLGAGGLAAGQSSSSLGVNLDTATAGVYAGTANLAFASHDSQLSDLALAGSTLDLKAQVNNYAALAFSFGSGLGSLSFDSGTHTWTLNLGKLLQNSNGGTASSALAFLNSGGPAAFTDLLSSQGAITSGTGFSLSGDSVTGLAGDASEGGFDIGLDTSNAGVFNELLAFNVNSSNASGYDADLGSVDLDLTGDVITGAITPVPEPGALGMFGLGLGALGGLLVFDRRRRHAAR